MPLTLTRELRFGLHENPPPASGTSTPNAMNGFAANPPLLDIAPFLTLLATVTGNVDPSTGMLVNIKQVDRILREHAVPFIRVAHFAARYPAPAILLSMMPVLRSRFEPHVLTALRLALSPYLSYTARLKEPGMVQMSLRFEFSAAHRLHSDSLSPAQNLEIFGRCNNPNGHGHNYELEVNIASAPDSKTGEFMGVLALQRIVNQHIIEPRTTISISTRTVRNLPTLQSDGRKYRQSALRKAQAANPGTFGTHFSCLPCKRMGNAQNTVRIQRVIRRFCDSVLPDPALWPCWLQSCQKSSSPAAFWMRLVTTTSASCPTLFACAFHHDHGAVLPGSPRPGRDFRPA